MSKPKDRIDIKQVLKDVEVQDGPNEIVTDKNGTQKRRRAGRVQMQLRIQQVVTWLLEGRGYVEVMNLGVEKWGTCSRTIEHYIEEAKEQVEAHSATEIRGATTLAIYRLMSLYESCVAEGDLKTALDVIKTQNRLLGINAPDRIEAKTVENWDSMSIADQFRAIEEKIKGRVDPDSLN